LTFAQDINTDDVVWPWLYDCGSFHIYVFCFACACFVIACYVSRGLVHLLHFSCMIVANDLVCCLIRCQLVLTVRCTASSHGAVYAASVLSISLFVCHCPSDSFIIW